MTSPSLSRGEGFGPLSYARSRLYLGISGVGTAVLAATCLLVFDIPQAGFTTTEGQSVGRALFGVGIFFAMVQALFFLFDLLGGALVVRRTDHAPFWLTLWMRGVAVQWAVWMLTAATLMVTARSAGPLATVGAFVGMQLLLAQLRGVTESLIHQLVEAGILLPGTELILLEQDAEKPDEINIEIAANVPYPCNRINVLVKA
jgi:hypothetical protein